MNANEIPEGYKQDPRGNLIRTESIKAIDLLRDQLVYEIAFRARELERTLKVFKEQTMKDIEAFIDLSAKEYSVIYGGRKGNVTFVSFDGKFKITRAIAEHIVFDERLQVAKQLIDECLKEWASGVRSEVVKLINFAFEPDKAGKLNTERILTLRKVSIDDPKWKKAMEAISDSLTVTGSKSYIRIYRRDDQDDYKQVNLDLASI